MRWPRVVPLAVAVLVGMLIPAGVASSVGLPPGVQVFTPPITIPADCSVDVTKPLYDWINTLPQGTPSQPTEVQFASGGCYQIDGMIFLRALNDYVFDGNGARFVQSSVVNGELNGDPPPNRSAYCGITTKFVNASQTIPTGFDIMFFVEGGCDLVFENMTIQGTNTTGKPGGTLQQDSAIELAGAQRVIVTNTTINGMFGDFVTVTGLHETKFGGIYYPSFDISITNNSFSESGRQGIAVVYADRVTVSGNSILHSAADALDLEAETGGGVEGDILVTNNSIHSYIYLVAAITYAQLYSFAFTDNSVGPIKIFLQSKTKYPGHDITIGQNTSDTTTAWSNSYDILFANEVTGLAQHNHAPVAPPTPYFVRAANTSGQIAVQSNVLDPGAGAGTKFLPKPLSATSNANGTECDNVTSTGTNLDAQANPPDLNQCANVSPTQPKPAALPVFVTSASALLTSSLRAGTRTSQTTNIEAQPGTVTCTGVHGTVQFTPPLVTGGSAPEVASLQLTFTGCTSLGGGGTPGAGHGSAALTLASDGCDSLSSPSAVGSSLAIEWSPTGDAASTISFPGVLPVAGSFGFSLGGAGTTGTGSYIGGDTGGASALVLTLKKTAAQIAALCSSANGLQILPVDSGTLGIG